MKLQPKKLSLLLCTVWAGMHLPAVAQNTDNEKVLGAIVVTAAGYEQDIKDAPASISIITGEQLRNKPVRNLEDAVRHLEGVSVVGGMGNTEEINLRGMPGEYTVILVDGKRQGTRETMNRGTGGVQTNFIPPAEAIERIEVIRGPMSSLYGSDAMGGVINIITRKVPAKWSGSVTLGGIIQEDREKYGNTTQGSFWLSGPIADDVLALQIYGKRQNRSEDDIYYEGATGSNGKKDESIHAKLTITPNKNHDIILEAGRDELTYTATPKRTAAAANPTRPATYQTEHGHDKLSISHTGRWGFGTSMIAAYQEVGTMSDILNNGKSGNASPKVTNSILDAQLTLPFSSNIFKIGGQYNHAKATGISKQDPIQGYRGPANIDSVTVKSWALFAEDEYFTTDNLKLTGGVRYDKHENFGSHFTPRLYANYTINDSWSVRGGVAKGFKAPTIRQSIAGYCMTTGRAGSGLRPGTLCGNPNLKPEESTTQEIGIRFAPQAATYVSATVFNNDFKNKVASYDTGVTNPLSPGNNIYVYDNIDNVNIRGIELAASVPLANTLAIRGNYTYTKSKRKGSGGEPAYDGSSLDGKPLDKTPEHTGSMTLDWKPTDQLSTFVTGTYTGSMYWAAFRNGSKVTRKRGASTTFDLGASYDVTKNLSLKATVLNVSDKIVPVDTRTRDTGLDGNWMVDEGRRLWISGTYSF